jgi:hypothetical protein
MLCDALILSVASAVFPCTRSASGNSAHQRAGEMLARKSHLINTTPLMKNASVYRFLCALILGVSLSIVSAASAANTLNYQGRVISGGTAFAGSGQFKFALVSADGSTVYWKNDGTTDSAAPNTAVPLTVTKGIFSVRLGDTSLSNMAAISSSVFSNTSMALRIWFNDGVKGFQQLSPDQTVSESALTTIRNSGASSSTSSVSATSVQEELFMLRLQTGAYPSTISGITWSGIAWDVFNSENGVNSTVSSHTSSSYQGTRYVDSSSEGYESSAAVVMPVSFYYNQIDITKSISIQGKLVSYAIADFRSGAQSQTLPCITRFKYSDGTSSDVSGAGARDIGWATNQSYNPNPLKLVETVEFLTYAANSYGAGVKNAKVLVAQGSQLTVSINNAPSSASKFKVIIGSTRISGDSVSYSLTNGSTTMRNLEIGTQYSWSGSTPPTSLTFSINPAPLSAAGSTGISSYAIFFE